MTPAPQAAPSAKAGLPVYLTVAEAEPTLPPLRLIRADARDRSDHAFRAGINSSQVPSGPAT